jgi:hypothetical protein
LNYVRSAEYVVKMLIQDFVHISRPFAEIHDQIARDPHAILEALAVGAYREGEQLAMRIGPSGSHSRLSKKVCLDIGSPYERGDGVAFPICWWASGASWLFPCLDGDLEISPVEDGTTRITLSGRYEPPLASVGRGIDHMVLHRVAESSVRLFLTSIARALSNSTTELDFGDGGGLAAQAGR